MDRLKTFAKYALMVIGMYVFTSILVFVGFNLNYKDIKLNGDLPEQISIEKAETRSKSGRIYGYVSNNKDNNVNGKYIKIEVLNSKKEKVDIQFLKIDGVKYGEKKMFKAFFKIEDAKYYNIYIVDSEDN